MLDIFGAMPLHDRLATFTSVIALLVLACLGGCGGAKQTSSASKPTSSSSGLASSKTSDDFAQSTKGFIAHADAICRQTNAELAQRQRKGGGRNQVEAVVVENEEVERKTNGRLQELASPATLAPAWRKLLAYRRSLANQLGSLAAAMKNRATASVNALGVSKKQVHRELRQLATRTGFKDCAIVGPR